jgi:hypothetical protein
MGKTRTRGPHLPKFLSDRVIHLSGLVLYDGPCLVGLMLAVGGELCPVEMLSRCVPGMVCQPRLERRARQPAQDRLSGRRLRFEQGVSHFKPTLVSHSAALASQMPLVGVSRTQHRGILAVATDKHHPNR